MDIETAQNVRPDPTKMYGICHDANGSPVVRVPRVVKVGIGMPRGKDVMVFLDQEEQWHVVVAKKDTSFKTQIEAEAFYREQKPKAPEVNYPRKLSFFTFTRPAGDNSFDPDFDTIKAHGATPRELDIMFLDDRPLKASYEMWNSSQLRCSGDGVNAMRVLAMAAGKDEQDLARLAGERGEKYFPIVNGCFTRDCPYSKPTEKGDKEYPAACKPHAKIQFQLISAPRLGGVAAFETTSIRSISQLFSCIQQFMSITGYGDPEKGTVAGIPLKLVLTPFRVNHNGQPGTAYSVSLEFRLASVQRLREKLLAHAVQFREALRPPRQIEAPPDKEDPEDFDTPSADPEASEAAEAAVFTAEFVDERPVDIVKPGTVDAARQIAIHTIAEQYGYSPDVVEEYIDQPNCLELLDLKYGPPPKHRPPAAERVAKEMEAKAAAKKAGAASAEAEDAHPLFGQDKPKEPTPIRDSKKPAFGDFGKKK